MGYRNIWDAVPGTPHLGRSIWDEPAGYSPASSSNAAVRTRAPAARSAGLAFSASLWDTPFSHGTKIIPAGQTRAMYIASWLAPEARRRLGSRSSSAARATASTTPGSNTQGDRKSVGVTLTVHCFATCLAVGSTAPARRSTVAGSGCRTSTENSTWLATEL